MKACPECGRLNVVTCRHGSDELDPEDLTAEEITELLWASIDAARQDLDSFYDDLETVLGGTMPQG